MLKGHPPRVETVMKCQVRRFRKFGGPATAARAFRACSLPTAVAEPGHGSNRREGGMVRRKGAPLATATFADLFGGNSLVYGCVSLLAERYVGVGFEVYLDPPAGFHL